MTEKDHIEPPEIDPNSELHPYEQIAAWLERRIQVGDLRAGQLVPSEKTLGQVFPVARTTIRRAIKLLRDKHLVYTKHARGTFVTRPEDRPQPPSE